MRTTNLAAGALLKIAILGILFQTGIGHAAEVKVLSSNGIKASMEDLLPKFEKASGHKVAVTYAGGVSIEKQIRSGESADIIIIPKWNADLLVKDGKLPSGNVTAIARSDIGVGMRKGAAKPDISSADALKKSMLAAKSVAYNAPEGSGSGSHFSKVLEQLGIAKEIKAKSVLTTSGQVGLTVASGKAELGVTQISSLITVPGVEVVGPLPGSLQNTTAYTAGILPGAKNADAAKALVTFLRNAESGKVFKAKGMEPG